MERAADEAVDPDVDTADGASERPAGEARTQGPLSAGIGGDGHRGQDRTTPASPRASTGGTPDRGGLRVALVANAKSGSGGADDVADHLRAHGAEVTMLDFDAVCGGADVDVSEAGRIVAAGGDGTVGPAALLASRKSLPLAVVATGTANSFARWFELPLDLDEAAALAALADAPTRPAEVADADGRPFVNVAAAGLQVLAAERARPLKSALGPLAYAVGAVRAGITGKPLRLAVRADDETWTGEAWQVLVAATGAFGGDSGTGGVDPADGRLDVAIVPAGSRLKLVRRAWAMRKEQLVHEEEVVHLRAATVEVDAATQFNVDGEVLDLGRNRFTVAGLLEVVVGS